jgi:putative membrane protein
MLSVTDLPALNATLNGIATFFLVAGWVFVRQRALDRHRACMIAALVCSALFLTSYLVYHYQVGSRPFTGTGPIRTVYFAILITHVILATAIVPLVVLTVVHAWRERFDRHRAIARWTLPLWLYVSVTGVVVYLMLYRW